MVVFLCAVILRPVRLVRRGSERPPKEKKISVWLLSPCAWEWGYFPCKCPRKWTVTRCVGAVFLYERRGKGGGRRILPGRITADAAWGLTNQVVGASPNVNNKLSVVQKGTGMGMGTGTGTCQGWWKEEGDPARDQRNQR